MPAKKPPPTDEKPQFERFIETARAIGAGETDEALEQAIKKIALQKLYHRNPAIKPKEPK